VCLRVQKHYQREAGSGAASYDFKGRRSTEKKTKNQDTSMAFWRKLKVIVAGKLEKDASNRERRKGGQYVIVEN